MVGIDLHSNNALCGLMDTSGRRLLHKQLPCALTAILQLLKPYKKRIDTIAIESTYNWYWLVGEGRALGWAAGSDDPRPVCAVAGISGR